MLNTLLFKDASGALRLNKRREGLDNTGFPGRFLCLPPCWAPCTSCASMLVMGYKHPGGVAEKFILVLFFLLLEERWTSNLMVQTTFNYMNIYKSGPQNSGSVGAVGAPELPPPAAAATDMCFYILYI